MGVEAKVVEFTIPDNSHEDQLESAMIFRIRGARGDDHYQASYTFHALVDGQVYRIETQQRLSSEEDWFSKAMGQAAPVIRDFLGIELFE